MNRIVHSRLKTLLAAAIVAVGMSMSAWAEVVSGAENWTIEPGTIPHIIYDRNRGVNFAVDKYGSNGWEVVVHHTSGGGYVEAGVVGSTVNSATFRSDLDQIEGTGDVFRFVFHWWPSQQSGSTVHYYGWVSLGTSNGELVVLASEVADEPNAVLVGRGEPDSGGDDPGGDTQGGGDDEETDLMFDWVIIDRGDYLELGEQNQPTNGTSGKVIIPSEIGGKPVCSIGEAAFYSHDEIKQVIIPETVSNIGYKAFNCCMALERCNIPSGVTNIDEQAFSHTALGEISLPDGVREIKFQTFSHCESLTNAVWGAGVTNIGEMAFWVTALSNVTIGTHVEYIDFGAFQGCNMKNVSIWPWTRLGVQPFDLSCEIEYTGTVTNFIDFAYECGEAVTNLMVWAGRENFDGVTEFRVYDDYGPLYGYEYGTSKLLHYAGLAPGSPTRHGNMLEVKYTNPTIEIVSFDIATRTLKGKIVPQGGCRIAQMPEDAWIFGIWHYESLDSQGNRNWDATPDLTGYLDAGTLGEFTHTISAEDFATNRFFKLMLDN